jgi:hypothetical protein
MHFMTTLLGGVGGNIAANLAGSSSSEQNNKWLRNSQGLLDLSWVLCSEYKRELRFKLIVLQTSSPTAFSAGGFCYYFGVVIFNRSIGQYINAFTYESVVVGSVANVQLKLAKARNYAALSMTVGTGLPCLTTYDLVLPITHYAMSLPDLLSQL